MMYRDMPLTHRSLAAVAELAGRGISMMFGLSASNHWVARSQAWDMEQARLYVAELASQRKRVVQQHLRVSDAMMKKALERLATLEPESISPRDIGGFIATAAEVARKALGMDAGQQGGTTVQVSATAGDTESGQAARVEVKVAYDDALRSMEELAARMTPEQMAEAADSWKAAAGKVIDGEVVG